MLNFVKSRIAGKKLFTILFTSISLSAIYSQDTIHIPNDYTTIQEGIDAANIGDMVLVAEGNYIENINYIGKAITVASWFLIDGDTTHITNTIIDGSQPIYSDSASVVSFKSGEDSNSVLSGFTLTGGSGTIVWIWGHPMNYGGGIFCLNSSPRIFNSIIKSNQSDGIYTSGGNANPYLKNVNVYDNSYWGLNCQENSAPTFERMSVSHHSGSGIFVQDASPILSEVDIGYNGDENNVGGGINVCEWIGTSNIVLSNVNIHHNIAYCGGGINCSSSTISLSNVTIKHNIAKDRGGGISIGDCSEAYFDSVNRCNIYLNYSVANGIDIATDNNQTYNIFIDTFTVIQPSDIHLFPINQFSFNIQNGKIQQVQSDLYINPVTGDDDNSGLTPSDPLKTITMGLYKAIATEYDPRKLYLAEGLYTPENEFYFPLSIRSNFTIKGSSQQGVILDAMGRESIFSIADQSNVFLENITLTGSYDVAISSTGNFAINNATVKENMGKGIRAIGTSIINNVTVANNEGSGIDLNGNVAIINTIVENNNDWGISLSFCPSASLESVTIQNNNGKPLICGGNLNLIANNLLIRNNKNYGFFNSGGIEIAGSTAEISNSIISNNEVQGRGGGIYISGAAVDLSNVTISHNKATYKGGGMFIDGGAVVNLSEVSVFENRVDTSGGVVWWYNQGGGIYIDENAEVYFDSVNRCNIYLNEGTPFSQFYGTDLCAEFYNGIIDVVVDTFTVLEPTSVHAYPLEKFTFDILHAVEPSSVEDAIITPLKFALSQNYPNPFNPSTKIKYSVPQNSQVQIKVFDVLGNEIETLVNEEKPSGTYEITWYAKGLPSGIYFYRIQAGDLSTSSGQSFIGTKKMLLLK